MPIKSPLHPLLEEINKAASNGMPFLAVGMAVALPDICASLAANDGRTTGIMYKEWCAKNLNNENFSYITPDDLYSMRCGVLHNGRFGDMKHDVSRVIFALPDTGFHSVNCLFDDAYVYSVVDFCKALTNAVEAWFETNRENPAVLNNLPRLMQYRERGIPPYVVGVKVLA